ncbi:ribosome maturation factor RimM [Helcococcus kunzii]|uniref:ribosome maturation factor RimM n=1 Tax=Helcococcus kunzii TaxID=40091 RepID=UPI001BB013EB|nr:ribosome maturation factor RimM [Helcococcus kunzii]QUY64788.1 16S rRNA processing protein RimM [Helcococcus kunzii]
MEKIKVGTIINTHGIKGELKVERTGIEEFDRVTKYYIEGYEDEFEIKSSKIHKGNYIILLDGYNNINDVLKFKGKSIYISSDDLIDLEDDEFYIKDLIGIEVIDNNDKEVGKVVDVLEYDVNDVYVVKSDTKEMLIPAVAEFILDIDLENNKMKVKLIEGM